MSQSIRLADWCRANIPTGIVWDDQDVVAMCNVLAREQVLRPEHLADIDIDTLSAYADRFSLRTMTLLRSLIQQAAKEFVPQRQSDTVVRSATSIHDTLQRVKRCRQIDAVP